jgi:hypothetical protein
MRWTLRRARTNGACCGRRSRVVLTPRRWRQVCGMIRRRRWQKSPVTGESPKETVKTIAQGMPGQSGEPVVANSCAFLFRTRGYGCGGHPAFPAPSDFEGRTWQNSDASRRGREELCLELARHCEERSDEAIQSPSFRDGPKDQTSDAQLRIGESRDSQMCNCTSQFDASHRPGMTARMNRLFENRIGNRAGVARILTRRNGYAAAAVTTCASSCSRLLCER